MKVEITEKEIKRITPIIKERYDRSVNLFERMELKEFMGKIGVDIEDVTPPLSTLTD